MRNKDHFPLEDAWNTSSMLNFKLTDNKVDALHRISLETTQTTIASWTQAPVKDEAEGAGGEKLNICAKFNLGNSGVSAEKPYAGSEHMMARPPGAVKPRLFWAILFNDEKEVLKWALHEMYPMLHSFVIVEANLTFTGDPRRLRFPKYHSEFAQYSDKVVYVPWAADSGHRFHHTHSHTSAELREQAVRNSIGDIWRRLGILETDIAIVANADEFVSREFLQMLIHCDAFPVGEMEKLALERNEKERHDFVKAFNKTSKELQHNNGDPTMTLSMLIGKHHHSSRTHETKTFDKQLIELENHWRQRLVNARCHPSRKLMASVWVFASYIDCARASLRETSRGDYVRLVTKPGIKTYWHPDAISGECIVNPFMIKNALFEVEDLRNRGGSHRITASPVGWHYSNLMSPESVLYKMRTYSHPNESVDMNVVLGQRDLDCKHSLDVITESRFSVNQLPLYLQDPGNLEHLDPYFSDRVAFYQLLAKHV